MSLMFLMISLMVLSWTSSKTSFELAAQSSSVISPLLKLQIQALMVTSQPRSQAFCKIEEFPRLYIYCAMLISHNLSTFLSKSLMRSRSFLYRRYKSLIWRSQLLMRPSFGFQIAALTPPHWQCPQMIMCLTFSTSTAYCTTDSAFRSVWMI